MHPCTAGRRPPQRVGIGRIVTMLVVAAFFLLPILGFVSLIFRSEEGLNSGEAGFLGLGGMYVGQPRVQLE